MKYTCRVALAENIESGFVWIGTPKVESRQVVRIKNCDNGRSVYCQTLNIDDNFAKKYNKNKKKTTITKGGNYIIASKWYRDKLGIKKNKDVVLSIRTEGLVKKWWAYQASKAHPENSIRLSVLIATLSLFLGLVALIISIAPLFTTGIEPEILNISKQQDNILHDIIELNKWNSEHSKLSLTATERQNLVLDNLEVTTQRVLGNLASATNRIDNIEKKLNSNAIHLMKISSQQTE